MMIRTPGDGGPEPAEVRIFYAILELNTRLLGCQPAQREAIRETIATLKNQLGKLIADMPIFTDADIQQAQRPGGLSLVPYPS